MSHGLLFLMDYNTNRMGPDINNLVVTSLGGNIADEEDDGDKNNEAMIYIETLGMYNNSFLFQS